MAKKLETGAKQAALDIKALGAEVIKLTNQLEGLEKGTADYEKVNAKLQNKLKQIGSQVKQNTTDHKNSKNAIDAEVRALRTHQATLDRSSVEYAQASVAIREHQQSLNQNTASTGLASTSAMEFGRVISDAPYGIRGMANNVSQLTSLLFQGAGQISATTGKVIGLKGAIQGMWGAMMGPLGIMIAIQAVIAAVDYFAGSTEKAEEAANDFGGSISELTRQINDNNAAQENLNDTISSYVTRSLAMAQVDLNQKKVSEEASEALATYNERTADAVILAGQLMRKKYFTSGIEGELTRANKDAAKALEEYNKLVAQSIKLENEMIEMKKEANAPDKGTLKYWEMQLADQKKEQKNNSNNAIEFQEYAVKIAEIQKEIDAITGGKKKNGKDKKALKDFTLNQSKMDSLLIKSLREQELLLAESNAEKLRLNNQYAEEDLITAFNSEVEKDAKKLEVFLKGKASPEQKAKAKRLHEENEKARTADYEESLTQIRYNAFIEENQLIEETKQAFDEQKLSTEIEREQNRLSVLEDALGNDPKSLAVLENQQRMIWAMEDANYELTLERRRDELFGIYENETQVQEIIDEERTERDRVRAEGEVQLERDKADAKMAIQLEYLNYVQSLGNTLSILGKKNKALAIVGLAVEKGSAIASIIVKAAASNAAQTASDAAFISAANLKYALVPGGQAAAAVEIAANTATSAKARAKTNITAGLSIAKIAATSLTSSALGGGTSGGSDSSGGGGGGSTTFTPNFNVVGNSGTNQLAEGISNQVNEPTRAYVVYEDIAEAGNVVEESVESSGI